jgi:hypothetical protein
VRIWAGLQIQKKAHLVRRKATETAWHDGQTSLTAWPSYLRHTNRVFLIADAVVADAKIVSVRGDATGSGVELCNGQKQTHRRSFTRLPDRKSFPLPKI